jgi:hypothetical protein
MESQDLPQVGDIYVKHRMLYDRYCLVIRISRGYIWYKLCDINGIFSEYEKERRCNKNEAFRELGEKVTILHRKKKQAEADAIQRSYKTAAICQKIIGIVSKPNLKITDAQLSELENIINLIVNENTN